MNCLSYGGHWYYWHWCMSCIFNGVDVLTVGIRLINQTLILCIQLVVRTIQVFLETWDDLHIHLKMSLSNCHWCVFTPCTSSSSCHCRCAGTVLPSGHRNREFILGKSFRMIKSSHESSTTTLVTIKPYPGARSMVFCTFPGMVTPPMPREVNERIYGVDKKAARAWACRTKKCLGKHDETSSCPRAPIQSLCQVSRRGSIFWFLQLYCTENLFYISLLLRGKKKKPNMKKKVTKPNLLFSVSKKKIILLFQMKNDGCFIWSVPCVINNFCASVLLSLVMVLR